MQGKRKLAKIMSLLAALALAAGNIHAPAAAYAAEETAADYYVNLSELTYTDSTEQTEIRVYPSDAFDTFVSDYENGILPDIYITEFLYDGISQVKKISTDDETGEVSAKTISTTVININTTGNIEFSGTAEDTMIAVDTNGVKADINLILNNANITSSGSTPAVMVYNKDASYDDCKVSIKTIADTKNYITGGKLKKVSTMTVGKADTYKAASSQYADTANGYYYVYTDDEIEDLLYAQETADREKIAEGDPYTYYKFSGAVGSDIALYFEGEGYLEIASLSDEGVETKGDLSFIGGKGDYKVTSYDDGLNASTSGTDIFIDVHSLLVSVNADAEEGDAIDSNGTIHIQGGTIFAFAHPTSQDDGLDSDFGTYINGGTVIASGNMSDSISDDSEQDFIKLTFRQRQSAETLICITDTNDTPVMAFRSDRAFTTLTYSSGDFAKASYYVYKNGDITGTEENGLYTQIDSYTPGSKQQWSGSTGSGAFGGGGMKPSDMPNGENPSGNTPPDMPDGENLSGNTPPDMPDGENPSGNTPPDMPDEEGPNGNTPPDMPGGEDPNGNTRPGEQQPDQNAASASTEFTISATSHTFNNVTDYSASAVYGDVDGNGTIDANDALEVLKIAARLAKATQIQQMLGDINGNGSLDAEDALWILKKAAKLIDFFPLEGKSV